MKKPVACGTRIHGRVDRPATIKVASPGPARVLLPLHSSHTPPALRCPPPPCGINKRTYRCKVVQPITAVHWQESAAGHTLAQKVNASYVLKHEAPTRPSTSTNALRGHSGGSPRDSSSHSMAHIAQAHCQSATLSVGTLLGSRSNSSSTHHHLAGEVPRQHRQANFKALHVQVQLEVVWCSNFQAEPLRFLGNE